MLADKIDSMNKNMNELSECIEQNCTGIGVLFLKVIGIGENVIGISNYVSFTFSITTCHEPHDQVGDASC